MKRSASASRSSVLIPGRRISPIRASVPATIRPARPMISTSRGDFSVIMLLAKGPPDPLRDLFHGACRGDAMNQVSLLVPVEHGGGLLPVGPKPGGHGLGVVVGALFDRTPLREPGENFVVRNIEEQHGIHLAALLGQEALDALRLGNSSHHPVKDDA